MLTGGEDTPKTDETKTAVQKEENTNTTIEAIDEVVEVSTITE